MRNRRGFLNEDLVASRKQPRCFPRGSEKQQFNARFNRIRHALATIKNKTLPRQAGVQIDLTPRKFRMATCTGTFLEQPILSLIFHVVDGQDSDVIYETCSRVGRASG